LLVLRLIRSLMVFSRHLIGIWTLIVLKVWPRTRYSATSAWNRKCINLPSMRKLFTSVAEWKC